MCWNRGGFVMAKANLAGLTPEAVVLIKNELKWAEEHLREVEYVIHKGRQPHSEYSIDIVAGLVKARDGIDEIQGILTRLK
ncbi:hypothetical protein KKD19_04750 [Patescibacteria group bacterium]|nr:hypothetical protein [Patescibacteria group bacterium]MBU4512518.1 hypothetical protein [Patescibacteria group bacterium]